MGNKKSVLKVNNMPSTSRQANNKESKISLSKILLGIGTSSLINLFFQYI